MRRQSFAQFKSIPVLPALGSSPILDANESRNDEWVDCQSEDTIVSPRFQPRKIKKDATPLPNLALALVMDRNMDQSFTMQFISVDALGIVSIPVKPLGRINTMSDMNSANPTNPAPNRPSLVELRKTWFQPRNNATKLAKSGKSANSGSIKPLAKALSPIRSRVQSYEVLSNSNPDLRERSIPK